MDTQNAIGWTSKRITVIGAGVSGKALAELARRLGAEVFVSDERPLSPDTVSWLDAAGISWEGGGHTGRAFDADVLLLSSGVSPNAFCVTEARRLGISVMGEMDFVAPHIRGRVVGVTGSNGKSTLTALCGHILGKAGLKVGVGGNIGDAASLFTQEPFDVVVLELSSFQLYWAHNLACEVSVVTNLAPDHIDWHGSYEAYVAAKARILQLQTRDGWGIVQDRDVEPLKAARRDRIVALSWRQKTDSDSAGHLFMDEGAAFLRLEGKQRKLFDYRDIALLGKHNLENVAMSLAAAYLLGIEAEMPEAVEGFRPLPHRCELAGIVEEVLYVDDSKGTNVAASVTALTSIKGRKIVILGGKGKGEDYAPLAETVLREAEAAILLGAESENIEEALKKAGFSASYRVSDMEEAVLLGRRLARPGMVVLLSPACTSWDMYENYKKRGEHFSKIVRGLVP